MQPLVRNSPGCQGSSQLFGGLGQGNLAGPMQYLQVAPAPACLANEACQIELAVESEPLAQDTHEAGEIVKEVGHTRPTMVANPWNDVGRTKRSACTKWTCDGNWRSSPAAAMFCAARNEHGARQVDQDAGRCELACSAAVAPPIPLRPPGAARLTR